ncbi:Beige/BEACH domain containing protein [Tritrichomonas foetus]|uniref:Beige/BEACH domain containing protein n=1 Tax=Tritrichomonas foetus TaxID=1144522 RepID=A0A1J4JHF7_9EUKA|nr:Beige/BEACH domain containing protein [Tritrichomonas foetus]|eukprot:OHS96917.1 Beige/BEACH domain containing protein [Tritrichomonas foetus]
MNVILSPNDLCSSILALKNDIGKENYSSNFQSSKINSTIKLLPDIINQQQLRDIKKQLSIKKPFNEVIRPFKNLMKYLIPEIKENSQFCFTNFRILMNTYLFVCIDYQNLDIEKALAVLQAINKFLLYSKNINTKQCQMLSSAFYNLYICTLSRTDAYDRLIPILCEFFVRPNKIFSSQFYEMLSETIRRVVNPNEKSLIPIAAQLLSFIDSLVIQLGSKFPQDDIKSILQMCCGAISGLDSAALLFLSHLSKVIDIESITAFLPLLPLSIMSLVNSCSTQVFSLNHFEKIGNLEIFHPFQCLNKAVLFQPESNFIESNMGQSIDLINTTSFPESLPISQILPKECLCKVNLIEKVVSSDRDLVTTFVQMIPKIFQSCANSEYALDAYSVFLFIMKGIAQKYSDRNILPIELLAHRVCFDPALTIFSMNDFISNYRCNQSNFEIQSEEAEKFIQNWEKINTLRSIAVELILQQGILSVQTILYGTMIYPQLFAELIHRFLNLQNLFLIDKKDVVILTQTLMSPMIYYQHYEVTDSTHQSEINDLIDARLSILLFINHIFTHSDLMSMFFEDQFFCESFLSLLYERPLRQTVIIPLLNYLSKKNSFENTKLINILIKITKNSAKSLETIDSINLLDNLLSIINKVVLMNSSFMPLFRPLVSDLCHGCIKMIKHEDSINLIYNIIQFITLTTMKHSMTTPEFIAVEAAITNVFEGRPTQILFARIVQLIAGQTLPSLHPSFTIHQPKALRLLVAVFQRSDMLSDVFNFIAKLLQFSIKNCEEAHRGEFDSYLIDFLYQFRDDEAFPIATFASALSLFMLISTNICSVSVVQSFISLFCPIEGKTLPFYQKLLIRSLSTMIPSANKRPLSSLPLSSKTGFNFKGLKGEFFQEGFTFSFWINLNSEDPSYKQQIIMIQDSKNNKCGVFVTSGNILVFFENDDRQWSAKPDLSIPLKKWSFVTICCFIDPYSKQFRVATSINGEDNRDLFFPMLKMQPGQVKGRIGGLAVDSNDVEYPSYIGTVGIYPPLVTDQLTQLYELGPCIETIKNIPTLAFFVPHERNGMLSVTNNNNDENIVITSQPLRFFHPIPFSDVLISKCGISSIIPLFAQWSLKFSNNESFSNFASLTIEILQNMLVLSEEAQKVFCGSDGFKIISHLMMESDGKHLNYPLYIQLFNLMNEINNEDLKRQLYDSILMNIELWMKCDAENHRRIARHWSKSLIQTCSEMTVSLRSFSWIISALRIYYWYEPIEHGIAALPNRCRGQKLNVKDCRHSLMAVGHFIAQTRFDENDFRNLISHILTCSDHSQNADLLNFLNSLIKEHHNLFEHMKTSIHLISLLQYLFNLNNNSVICSTLSTIVDAHKTGLFENFPISNHIDIILHQVVPQFVTKSMLTNLIDLTIKYPEAFPICSWVAMNIGDSGVRAMIKKLKPNTKLTMNESWALYPVVALYKGDEKLRRYLSRFLIKCSIENSLSILFATIEIVGRVLIDKSDTIKQILLIEFGKMIKRENLSINIFNEYITLVEHYLFYRIDSNENPALKELYDHSPFSNIPRVTIPCFSCCSPSRKKRQGNISNPNIHQSHLTNPQPITAIANNSTSNNSPIDNYPTNNSPKKSGNRRSRRRTSRHSLRPNSLLCDEPQEDRYSPLLAQKALACLNPIQPKFSSNESFRARRTSMLTFSKKAIDFDTVPTSPDRYNIEMMPSELDEKINNVAKQEFKFSFGIRLNKYKEWLDLDLAEQAFGLYLERKDDSNINIKCQESVNLIAAFLGMWKTNIIDSIDLNNQAMSILDHYLTISGKPRLNTLVPAIETEKMSFDLFQSFNSKGSNILKTAPLRFMKHLIKFQQINSEKAFDIFALITNEIVSLASNKMADFTDSIGQKKSHAGKLWSHFWQCATIERAPWHKSLPQSYLKQQHFKLDSISCFAYCPMKLKQNRNFTDHMDATFLRESGNYQSAKDLFEKHKAELAKMYAEKAPAQLLEITEGTIDDNSDSILSETELTRCLVELPCEIIRVRGKKNATFSLLNERIVITKEKNGKIITINLNQITEVFYRTYLHHPTAIEIFTVSGSSYFINFFDVKSMPIIRSFGYVSLPRLQMLQSNENFRSFFKDLPFTQQWINGKISNFEYLMHLNVFSGRTFNDPSQYPIMPWIIQDYVSQTLDLTNPETFRDLSKPMGALSNERLEDLKLRTRSLAQLGLHPYLYSSGAINPLSTYLFMVRLEPFTSLHIEIQSGKFDHAARLFNSIPNAFKLASTMMNDYREIIPEFYYMNEFLENKDHFDFGSYNGIKPNDVELPPWASNSFEFIYLHRKALESDYVSENLQKWIDLIWGEKQRGPKSIQANNNYMSHMYDDVWNYEENTNNHALRAQIEAILTHVGQIPHQLFTTAHPSKIKKQNSIPQFLFPVSYQLHSSSILSVNIRYVPSSRKIKLFSIDQKGECSSNIIDVQNSIKISNQSFSCTKKTSAGRSFSNGDNISYASFFGGKRTDRSRSETCYDSLNTPDSIITLKSVKNIAQIFQNNNSNKQHDTILDDDSLLVIGSHNKSELHRIKFNSSSISTFKNNNDNTLVMQQPDNIICVASDHEWIATANTDAIVSLYDINDLSGKPKYVFPSYTSSINCISINSEFHTMVCGTRDGSLLFCSLSNGSITRIINLNGCRPISLLITPSWGFVVVYLTEIDKGTLKHKVQVYSINGELVRTLENLEHGISKWSSFRNSKGFDYIIVSNTKDECFIYEAFYLNNLAKPFYVAPSPVATIAFLNEESVAGIATKDGRFILVPFDF